MCFMCVGARELRGRLTSRHADKQHVRAGGYTPRLLNMSNYIQLIKNMGKIVLNRLAFFN